MNKPCSSKQGTNLLPNLKLNSPDPFFNSGCSSKPTTASTRHASSRQKLSKSNSIPLFMSPDFLTARSPYKLTSRNSETSINEVIETSGLNYQSLSELENYGYNTTRGTNQVTRVPSRFVEKLRSPVDIMKMNRFEFSDPMLGIDFREGRNSKKLLSPELQASLLQSCRENTDYTEDAK